jgi:hypothetical protein
METNAKPGNRFNVSKHDAVTLLDARIHHDRYPLVFSTETTQLEAFLKEVDDFKRDVSGAGRMVYGSREGKHDDRIIACALAVWWLSRPRTQPTAFGVYGTYGDLGMQRPTTKGD